MTAKFTPLNSMNAEQKFMLSMLSLAWHGVRARFSEVRDSVFVVVDRDGGILASHRGKLFTQKATPRLLGVSFFDSREAADAMIADLKSKNVKRELFSCSMHGLAKTMEHATRISDDRAVQS